VGYSILKNFRAGEANKASMFLERFRSTLGIQNQAELSLAALDDLADLNRRRV
jgi:hypothetical protein